MHQPDTLPLWYEYIFVAKKHAKPHSMFPNWVILLLNELSGDCRKDIQTGQITLESDQTCPLMVSPVNNEIKVFKFFVDCISLFPRATAIKTC